MADVRLTPKAEIRTAPYLGPCVCTENLTPGRSGDEVRRGSGMTRCRRSAEWYEGPVRLCPVTGAF
jgi:hypothetical protein